MLYQKRLTVPSNTPIGNPTTTSIEVEEDYITYLGVYFPPGCCNLVHVRFRYGETQIFPHASYEWLSGEGYLMGGRLLFKTPESPCRIYIDAYSDDDTYDHTIIIYIEALRKEEVARPGLIESILGRLGKFLEKLGL